MNQSIRDVPDPDKLNYQPGETAEKESEAISSKIDLEKKTKQHERSEKARDVIASGTQLLIRVIIFVVVIAVLIVAFHHLTPNGWHWLSPKQLEDLRIFLFSGAIVGAISSFVQRHL